MLCIVPPIALLLCVKTEADDMGQINHVFTYMWDIITAKAEVASCFPAMLSGSLIEFSIEVIEKTWFHLELFATVKCI